MKVSELIATLEDILKANGDIEVFITNLGTGGSGKVDSVDGFNDVVQIYANHMDESIENAY